MLDAKSPACADAAAHAAQMPAAIKVRCFDIAQLMRQPILARHPLANTSAWMRPA
jgi:hypothetical protein